MDMSGLLNFLTIKHTAIKGIKEMNVFCFSGNITRDIELRHTQTGKQVANFGIAINEGKDQTTFLNCVAWEKTGELISQYVQKGDRLSGSGRIQVRKWQDQQGQDKYSTEVVVLQFDFPPKRDGQQSQPAQNQTVSQQTADMDQEIPF